MKKILIFKVFVMPSFEKRNVNIVCNQKKMKYLIPDWLIPVYLQEEFF